jgi:homospermidine synthase
VVLLKGAILGGSIFLAIFAFIGMTFFGWDVRKARASLIDVQNEGREILNEQKLYLAKLKVLKEELEQLGAQLDEAGPGESKEPLVENLSNRTSIDLIREVIRSSNYEWTTLGRVVKRTGLTRDAVLEEVRKASDIRIGTGRKTQDFIFKFKGDG